jgi:hypothetical protein
MRACRGMVLAFLTVSCSARLGQGAGIQTRRDDVDLRIVGTWRGSSVCLVKSSACRDEENVYRFSKIGGRSGAFSGTGSRVVGGQEIVMGRTDWTYDPDKQVLECKTPEIRMVLDGARMEGISSCPAALPIGGFL